MPSEIMFLDLEVDNHPFFGAIASPRHPENFVVMNGYAIEEKPYCGQVVVDHYRKKEEVPAKWLNIPDNVWLLVMHNAPFEMDWFLFQQRPEIVAYLKRGGRIFCTAYAEYLLSHQLETYPSLEETAPKYGGTRKVDGIKILWEQGHRTSQIDPVLLREYLGGPEGDVANTRLVFYGQYARLVEAGMWGMVLERMEGMVFNCFAMDAGLFVDRNVAYQQLREQEAELAVLTAGFDLYRTHIPPHINFNPGSDFHMSAWLFGGPIKYKGRVWWDNEDGTPAYEKADFVKTKTGKLVRLVSPEEMADVPDAEFAEGRATTLGPDMYDFDVEDCEKYKSGKNKGNIKVFREATTTRRTKWDSNLRFDVGPIADLQLLPDSIRKDFVKEFGGKRTLMDDSKVYSTGKDCLDMLALRKEFAPHVTDILLKLQKWAKLDKDIGTYYLREEKDDDGNVVKQSGMLQYLTDLNIIYHGLNTSSTITTRLSSTRPNLQNIPRGDTSDVKKVFTSRYDDKEWLDFAYRIGLIDQAFFAECHRNIEAGIPNGFIIEADYSALEVVTLAAFSKDKALCQALMDGIDMHSMRLAGSLNEPYADVVVKAKDQSHPEYPRYSVLRTLIKPKAFQYQYGATAMGIAFSTGCTVEEAQLFIDTEKALFPEVETFFDNVIIPAVHANSKTYREQQDDGSWRMFNRGHWQAPGGTCYSFRQYEKREWVNGQSATTMQFRIPQIRNYPIQGESGFFVQGICGKVVRWLIQNDFFGGRVFVINTVHDAIYLDCHRSVLDTVAAGVQAIMESLPQHFNANFGYDLQVPFPAAVEFGRSMHEKIHWHVGVLDDPKVQEKFKQPATV